MKLPFNKPARNKLAIHSASHMSAFFMGTFFMDRALTNNKCISSTNPVSKIEYTGCLAVILFIARR